MESSATEFSRFTSGRRLENGWNTGFPRDHARTAQLLLDAGSPVDPTMIPTGNDELDGILREWIRKHPDSEPSTSAT
jgi:hypothetical protein